MVLFCCRALLLKRQKKCVYHLRVWKNKMMKYAELETSLLYRKEISATIVVFKSDDTHEVVTRKFI